MRTAVRLALGAAAVGLLTASLAADDKSAAPKPPPGFTALFNGKDLSGWQGNTTMKDRATLPKDKLAEKQQELNAKVAKFWKVEDGMILCTGGKGGPSLQTVKDYGNFELLVDWKIEKKGDSGIYLRGQPQVQIWDSDTLEPTRFKEDLGKGSGGLWNNPAGDKAKVPLKKADKPVGEWNTFHITVVGDQVTVKLNGELVVDKGKLMNFWDKGQPVPAKGPVELQFHGDPLWFKNIYIKEIP